MAGTGLIARTAMLLAMLAATIGFTTTVSTAAAEEARIAEDPDVVITYRKGVMSIIGANTHALADIAKGKLDAEGAFGDHADMLAMAGELTYAAFRQNTHGQGKEKTTAKEKVWTDWKAFKEGLDKMNEEAIKVADYAAQGDLASAKGALEGLFKTCKSCHDDFRDK